MLQRSWQVVLYLKKFPQELLLLRSLNLHWKLFKYFSTTWIILLIMRGEVKYHLNCLPKGWISFVSVCLIFTQTWTAVTAPCLRQSHSLLTVSCSVSVSSNLSNFYCNKMVDTCRDVNSNTKRGKKGCGWDSHGGDLFPTHPKHLYCPGSKWVQWLKWVLNPWSLLPII